MTVQSLNIYRVSVQTLNCISCKLLFKHHVCPDIEMSIKIKPRHSRQSALMVPCCTSRRSLKPLPPIAEGTSLPRRSGAFVPSNGSCLPLPEIVPGPMAPCFKASFSAVLGPECCPSRNFQPSSSIVSPDINVGCLVCPDIKVGCLVCPDIKVGCLVCPDINALSKYSLSRHS